MAFLSGTKEALTKETVDILEKVKANIRDGSDCVWALYDNAFRDPE
jgi:hypothetical protein